MSLPPLKTICLSLIVGTIPAGHSVAQSCARDAMLVIDGSASMAEVTFDTSVPTRIEDARAAVAQAMPEIAPVRRVGL
ncbi:MAG: hypothetical protein AAGA97_05190, partial [Pseudomonadota bacterium]